MSGDLEGDRSPVGDNRPAVYWEDDNLIFRASAFGNCDGELVRHGLEVPGEGVPDWLQKRFDEGTRGEAEIIAALCDKMNIVIDPDSIGDNQLETEYQVGRSVIRCHPDGTGIMKLDEESGGGEIPVVIEVKLLGPDAKAIYDRHGISGLWSYDWQAGIEMLSTGRTLVYGVAVKDADGNPKRDKDGVVELDVTVYDDPPRSEQEIRRRLLTLTSMIRKNTIPECSKKQFPCGFYQYPGTLCNTNESREIELDARVEIEAKISDEVKTRIELLGSTYQEAKAREKAAKDIANNAKEKLLKEFADLGMVSKGDGVGVVRIAEGRSSGKYDVDAAKADGVDLKKYWVQGKTYQYIKIEKEK